MPFACCADGFEYCKNAIEERPRDCDACQECAAGACCCVCVAADEVARTLVPCFSRRKKLRRAACGALCANLSCLTLYCGAVADTLTRPCVRHDPEAYSCLALPGHFCNELSKPVGSAALRKMRKDRQVRRWADPSGDEDDWLQAGQYYEDDSDHPYPDDSDDDAPDSDEEREIERRVREQCDIERQRQLAEQAAVVTQPAPVSAGGHEHRAPQTAEEERRALEAAERASLRIEQDDAYGEAQAMDRSLADVRKAEEEEAKLAAALAASMAEEEKRQERARLVALRRVFMDDGLDGAGAAGAGSGAAGSGSDLINFGDDKHKQEAQTNPSSDETILLKFTLGRLLEFAQSGGSGGAGSPSSTSSAFDQSAASSSGSGAGSRGSPASRASPPHSPVRKTCLERRFRKTDTVQKLFDYLDLLHLERKFAEGERTDRDLVDVLPPPGGYTLSSRAPRRAFDRERDGTQTLQAADIQNLCGLMVDPRALA